MAKTCREKLAASGLDKASVATSNLEIETRRSGTMLSVSASEPVEKVDVVSFSGQTVKTYTLGGKRNFEVPLNDLPKEKLVFYPTDQQVAPVVVWFHGGAIPGTIGSSRQDIAEGCFGGDRSDCGQRLTGIDAAPAAIHLISNERIIHQSS